jgi:hypothetical protein
VTGLEILTGEHPMQHGDFVSLLLSLISLPKEEKNLPEITKQ